jgi:hypothetical protein
MSGGDNHLAKTSATPARFNWTGLDPQQMKNVAQAMAMSGMFPDIAKDSAKAFVKIMAGQEMGIPPFQAMSDISIISGKAAAGGNIYASKVKSHPRYDYRVKNWTSKGCAIEFFEVIDGKREIIGTSQFDEKDAQTAGLLGKGNWKTYPRNMYFNRAMTAGVRTFCPDALNGVNAYTPEELGADVDEDGRAVVDNTATFPHVDEPAAEDGTVDNQVFHKEADDPAPDDIDQRPAAEDDPEVDELADDMDLVDLAAERKAQEQQSWVIPEFTRTRSGMVQPAQLKLLRTWLGHYRTIDEQLADTFILTVLGKDRPATFDDAMKAITMLADVLNGRRGDQA